MSDAIITYTNGGEYDDTKAFTAITHNINTKMNEYLLGNVILNLNTVSENKRYNAYNT